MPRRIPPSDRPASTVITGETHAGPRSVPHNGTRRAILARLAEGKASVGELAEPFALSLPAISKHIKVLERAWLVVHGQRPSSARARSTPLHV